MTPKLTIITGGQSGVDRAALDAALQRGIPHGGWCPRGGWAEDLPDPPGLLAKYPELKETPGADPAQRTEWNVRDADATLILVAEGGLAVSSGTGLAESFAGQYGKPVLTVDLGAPDATARAAKWLSGLLKIHTDDDPFRLGIGGPRESEVPGIYERARAFIGELLDGVG